MNHFHRLHAYLSYWLNKTNRHSLHSPFIYNLYNAVIAPSAMSEDDSLSRRVKKLSSREDQINTQTLGAPSRNGRNYKKTIGQLARHGSTSVRNRKLLENLIRYFECQSVYELGTSLGLTTLYLSRPENTSVFTFEGNSELAAFARELFENERRQNIKVIEGDINVELPINLRKGPPPDLIYIDANHRYDPTLDYTRLAIKAGNEHLICVIGDIYWSEEMTRAWEFLRNMKEVTISIDLFEIGLLFFKKQVTPGHYIL